MPAPRTQSLNFLGPKKPSTKPTRPCTCVRNADGTMTNVDAARIKPSTREGRWSRGVPRGREGTPSHCPPSYVDCGESYRFPGAPAGCCLPRDTTRGRFHVWQRSIHRHHAEG